MKNAKENKSPYDSQDIFKKKYETMMLKNPPKSARSQYVIALVAVIAVVIAGAVVSVIFTPEAGAIVAFISTLATLSITQLFIAIRSEQVSLQQQQLFQQGQQREALQLEILRESQKTTSKVEETRHALNSLLDAQIQAAQKVGQAEGEAIGRAEAAEATAKLADELHTREEVKKN
jgi:hypothetical protein